MVSFYLETKRKKWGNDIFGDVMKMGDDRKKDWSGSTLLSEAQAVTVTVIMELKQQKLLLVLILTLLFATATPDSEYVRPLPRKTLTTIPWDSISKAHSSYPQQVLNQPLFHSSYSYINIILLCYLFPTWSILQYLISFVFDWIMLFSWEDSFFFYRVIFSKLFSISSYRV